MASCHGGNVRAAAMTRKRAGGGDSKDEIAELRQRVRELEQVRDEMDELRFFHAALSSSVNGVALTDRQGRVVHANEALRDMMGYEHEGDLVGSPAAVLFACEELAQLMDGLAGGKRGTTECVLRRRDGAFLPVEVCASPVMAEHGDVIGGMLSLVDISARKKATERARHLTKVLHAIRNVNQLIVRETDRERLIRGVCERLVAGQGYITARLVLLDDAGHIDATASAGPEGMFPRMADGWQRGDPPACVRRSLIRDGPVVIREAAAECTGCPYVEDDGRYGVYVTSLTQMDTCYGVFSVAVPVNLVDDPEELGLFREVAADVAFALYSLELAEQHERAVEELRRSEEKYRLTSENIPVFVYSALPDEHSTNLFISGRARDLTGYAAEEFMDNPELWSSIIHPDDRAYVWKTMEEHRQSKTKLDVEYRIITRDGDVRWVRDTATPSLGDSGDITRIDGFMQDITGRKQAEEYYRTVFENTGAATCIIEEDTTLSLVNEQFEKLSGFPREYIEGQMSWTDFVVDEDLERMKRYHVERRKNGGSAPTQYEFRFVDRHGAVKDILLTIDVIEGTTKSVASLLDVTAQKKAEEQYRCVVENAHDAIYLIHPERGFQYVNPAFEELTGYSTDEIHSDTFSFWDIIHPDDMAMIRERGEARARGETLPERYEFRILAKGGMVKTVEAVTVDIAAEDILVMGILRDVTERQRAEQERERAMVEVERALELEKRFKADAAHFFLNPIAICKGYLEIHMETLDGDTATIAAARKAIMRIEAVIKNIVEKGEIHE